MILKAIEICFPRAARQRSQRGGARVDACRPPIKPVLAAPTMPGTRLHARSRSQTSQARWKLPAANVDALSASGGAWIAAQFEELLGFTLTTETGSRPYL